MSANPHTSPLAVALFEAFARNGGNRPNDHFDRNAAEQWMQQALDECLPKPAAAQEAVRQPDGYHYRYPDLYGTDTCIRKNNGEEVNGSKPVEAVPYWYAPVTAAPGIDLAPFREAVEHYRSTHAVASLGPDSWQAAKVAEADRLLALIDAGQSNCWPEGGYAERVERLMGMSRGEREAIGARPVDSPKGGSDARACSTCGPDGIMATDGTGPWDCYACGKKAGDAEVQP